MLDITELETGYGKKQVLFGLSLEVSKGEIVALIGPNGAGKSTLLKAIFGLLPLWRGSVRFQGALVDGWTPAQVVARGIAFAPQGRRVFDELTVRENLEIGGFHLSRQELKRRIEEGFALFPILKNRGFQEAGRLSGGEQQMLALARALVPQPKLLMLDEPSLGLSPGLVNSVFHKITDVSLETGTAFLIVEQKVNEILRICHRIYSLKLGKVVFSGYPNELMENKEKLRELFL